MRKKTEPLTYDERHEQFLKIGKKLMNGDDLSQVKGATIAREAGVTGPLVFSHFGDRDSLREAVRQYAKGPAPKKSKRAAIDAGKKSKRAAIDAGKKSKPVAKKPKPVAEKPKPVTKKITVAKGKFSPPPAPSVQ